MYYNYNLEDKKEIEYKAKSIVNISNYELVEEIGISNLQNYYTLKSGENIYADDICYKSIEISKENIDEMLGETGKIEILDEKDELLIEINSTIEPNEEGYLKVNFESPIKNVNMKRIIAN